VRSYHMMLQSVAYAKQRLQSMRSNDVPASLSGEERHCLGVGAAGRSWSVVRKGSTNVDSGERSGSVTSVQGLHSQIRRDYPLNLSISLSGGKETNQDSPSNGE
jgi:hypothetical protein